MIAWTQQDVDDEISAAIAFESTARRLPPTSAVAEPMAAAAARHRERAERIRRLLEDDGNG